MVKWWKETSSSAPGMCVSSYRNASRSCYPLRSPRDPGTYTPPVDELRASRNDYLGRDDVHATVQNWALCGDKGNRTYLATSARVPAYASGYGLIRYRVGSALFLSSIRPDRGWPIEMGSNLIISISYCSIQSPSTNRYLQLNLHARQ